MADSIADIHARIAAAVDSDPRSALQVILDEEGPEALIDAVLAARNELAGQPTDAPTEADQWAERVREATTEVLDTDEVVASQRLIEVASPGSMQMLQLIVDSHEALRALVGGRSAAPTRDEDDGKAWAERVHQAITEPPLSDDEAPGSPVQRATGALHFLRYGIERPDHPGLKDAAYEQVKAALLSRSAAEPPEDQLCGCGDGLSSVQGARCGNCMAAELTPVESKRDELRKALAGVITAWNDCTPPADLDDYMTPWLARAKHALRGVAAEPPEDEMCAQCRTRPADEDTGFCTECMEWEPDGEGWVAAEPNEETESDG